MILTALLAVAALAAPIVAHGAAEALLDPDAVIERSEAAIGRKVGPYVLTDSNGAPLPLSEYRGRPLVISLIYTSCSSVCPVTTQHLLDVVEEVRGTLGDDAFAVLSVGFDARNDTPARLDSFASAQGIDLGDWRLASADEATISALLDDLGFSYRAVAGAFQHITQTTILDAKGRVYRQVYGDSFPVQIFMEPLKELVFGTIARSLSVQGVVDRVKFLCTVYNPSTGAYEFDYAIFFGIAIGGFSLLIMGIIVFGLWRNNRRLLAARAAQGQGQG
jgi:protein SCO1/2